MSDKEEEEDDDDDEDDEPGGLGGDDSIGNKIRLDLGVCLDDLDAVFLLTNQSLNSILWLGLED